ncbi:MAG: PTS mannitol transporter subunit IICB [Acidimicrobiales bacterium]|nr:PTS mannitol transporter subunit IICB [Acidimicrobiales bacterium]MYG89307.1 PTS mannitol transporter subunit IICB [Acidimicrobiales bacterium]MYI29138.1 PTS mannitol transporter subunit IICB [Acidimicrobiales bacterium]MYJ47304.1 PTS mannitol transporter subunit IICB [Acidimicrobiales bacterium]
MLQRVQRFGGFLSSMVIPNIGAFIAWGLITALFIPTGWLAKTNLDWDWGAITGNTVGPMIKYLLPMLVAYTGGKLIHGHRGGVLGAVAVLGVIGGASFELSSGAVGDPPQFLGAMVIGPLAGWVMREIDKYLEDKRPAGFEMLINNFSQGIAGVIMAMLGYVVIGPIMSSLATAFGNMVEGISDAGLLPLMDLPIEVGKVLFLNNAINHGVLTPLGTTDVAESGYSIYYMLESNPGPGLGLLLAYWFAGKGLAKLSAPGSIIIHFFGGIHEVYFPYVLMNPVMIGAMWAGGIVADIVFVIFDAGLTGPPSPGSIFAYFSFLPSDGGAVAGVLLGIAAGAAAAFIVGSILLRLFPVPEIDDSDDDTSLDDAMEGVPLN